MNDEERRRLERAAAAGDVSAQAKLLAEQLRTGQITERQIKLQALLGLGAATMLYSPSPLEVFTVNSTVTLPIPEHGEPTTHSVGVNQAWRGAVRRDVTKLKKLGGDPLLLLVAQMLRYAASDIQRSQNENPVGPHYDSAPIIRDVWFNEIIFDMTSIAQQLTQPRRGHPTTLARNILNRYSGTLGDLALFQTNNMPVTDMRIFLIHAVHAAQAVRSRRDWRDLSEFLIFSGYISGRTISLASDLSRWAITPGADKNIF